MSTRNGFKYQIERKDKNTGYTERIWVDDIKGLKGWKVIQKVPCWCQESGLRRS